MKSPILFAPTLIELAFMAALCSPEARAPASPTLTPAQRNAEIRELHREGDAISARLNSLESQGHQFLPRGMGPAP